MKTAMNRRRFVGGAAVGGASLLITTRSLAVFIRIMTFYFSQKTALTRQVAEAEEMSLFRSST
jgi:hypothetical protein